MKTKNMFKSLAFIGILSGCNATHIKGGGIPAELNEKLSTVGFADVKAAVLEPHCARCHSWVTDYAQVAGNAANIRAAVLSGRMPKDSSLAPELRDLLIGWIDLGAPELPPPIPTPEPVPAPASWDFARINREILGPQCLRCHGEATERNNHVSLASYVEVRSQLGRIREAVGRGQMPPRDPLPAKLRQALLDWIDQGAPETLTPEGEAL